jgi:pantothenate kinase
LKTDPSIDELLERVPKGGLGIDRYLLGIVGPPGGGKSQTSEALRDALVARDGVDSWQIVQMDGFHLSNEMLIKLHRRDRKGAPDTFDVDGFVALLDRIRADELNGTIFAPKFHRELEEAVAGSVPIYSHTRGIIIEGLYLLLMTNGWGRVASRLDECWFVDAPDNDERTRRLVERATTTYGEPGGERWVESVDQPNVRLVIGSMPRGVTMITTG